MLDWKLKVAAAQGQDEDAGSSLPQDRTHAANETFSESRQVRGQELIVNFNSQLGRLVQVDPGL
jgi:hypothetical protein